MAESNASVYGCFGAAYTRWAGAISIDLMPAVLVLILCVVHAAIRREGVPEVSAANMTAGEMMAALQMSREIEIETARRQVPGEADVGAPDKPAVEPAAASADENVTALSSARQLK